MECNPCRQNSFLHWYVLRYLISILHQQQLVFVVFCATTSLTFYGFFSTPSAIIQAQGVGAGLAYGALNWAWYPDRFAFAQKDTVTAGPARGSSYIMHTVIRPTVAFSVVTLTYSGVESLLENLRGSHHKDPWNSAYAGAAAGLVLGGFLARRFDVATCTALGTGLVMGAVDFNGPSIFCDPATQKARQFPAKINTTFEESDELKGLKDKYPAYKYN